MARAVHRGSGGWCRRRRALGRRSGAEGDGVESQLPPDWEMHEDDQGAIYFYNVRTEEVQWEAPGA